MRRLVIVFVILVGLIPIITYSQVPEILNYQAVIQDGNNELVANQNVSMKISILDDATGETVLFSETHQVKTTSAGIANVKIGSGTPDVGTFDAINWETGTKYLKTEIDLGQDFVNLGAVQLVSVPYALFAKDVADKNDADADPANEIQDLNFEGNVLTITKNPDATQINLASYQGTNTDEQVLSLTDTDLNISGGNTIDVSSLVNDADADPANELQNLTLTGDTLKISSGNDVVLPYDSSQWGNTGADLYYMTGKVGIGVTNPNSKLEVKADDSFSETDTLFAVKDKNGNVVFAVFPDGVRVIVDEQVKGNVGGFAVSGRGTGKGFVDYLMVTSDSTRVYIDDNTKAQPGGFAVSGRGTGKGTNDFLSVTPDSTRVYVNEGTKGMPGGFAVSGRGTGKLGNGDYLRVTKDSTRIYISDTSAVKGQPGGFAVSGRGTGKVGDFKDYFNVLGNASAREILNESRVMWYPEKSAFLAGELYVPDPDSVGENSMSLGYRNIAKGNWSQAMGYQSVARGPYSTAIGIEVVADTNSFAFGNRSEATGKNSFAFGAVSVDSLGSVTGDPTRASGDFSFAFGLGSKATKTGSFVMGTNCESTGMFSSAMGYTSKASGWGATAFGSRNNSSGDFSITLGLNNQANNTASVAFGANNISSGAQSVVAGTGNYAIGTSSVAIGTGNNASGDESFAGGRYNDCTATGSTAFGSQNNSTGNNTFAIGIETTASGNNAFTAGNITEASGDNSFAIGSSTVASNLATFAGGRGTKASGLYSMAVGYYTTASPFSSLVIGQYNTDTASWEEAMWNPADPLFIAGNGWDESTLDNAMVLYKNGNMVIAGTLTQDSDERLKTNIVNMESKLDVINRINPVYYEFKDQRTHPAGRQIGFIAQEIQPLFPELVKTGEGGFLSVDYAKMTVVLLQALKEQQKIIEQQQSNNESLQNQIDDINQKLKLLEEMIANQ